MQSSSARKSGREVREALERVLTRPEFQPETHSLERWVGELLQRFGRWLSQLFGFSSGRSAEFVAQALHALLILLAALVVFVALRRLVHWLKRTAEPAQIEVLPVALARARALRHAARDAAHGGDAVLALRLYFRALVVGLSERGDLEYRDAWTNRELFERGAPAAEVAHELRPLIAGLDAKSFGHVPVDARDVDQLARLCDRFLGALT